MVAVESDFVVPEGVDHVPPAGSFQGTGVVPGQVEIAHQPLGRQEFGHLLDVVVVSGEMGHFGCERQDDPHGCSLFR